MVPGRPRGPVTAARAYPFGGRGGGMGTTARTADTAQISVLGPVRLVVDGEDRTPRGTIQRRLLCALALRAAPATATRDGDLADLLWPAGLPADHRAALQTHIFRLRR